MKAFQITLMRFLDGSDKQFIVPLYQRAYKWTKNECEQLFDDIKNSTKLKSYFLGTVVHTCNRSNSKYNHILIDGQQRLTTISLLVKAIIEYIKAERQNLIRDELVNVEKLAENYLIDKHSKESSKLKLKQANNDAIVFAELVEYAKETSKNSNIVKNYNYFYERISSLSDDYIVDFVRCINNLEIVEINLDEEDKPQLIFESLNSTGLQLEGSDLIRNYILMGLSINKQNTIYKTYWQPIEKNANQETNDFMWCYLIAKYKPDIKSTDVYKEFKRYINKVNNNLTEELSTKPKLELELDSMLEYSKYYNYLQKPEDSTFSIPIQIYIGNIYTVTETTKFFLIQLIASYENKEGYIKNEKDLEEILLTLHTFTIRKFLLGKNTGVMQLYTVLHKRIITFLDKNSIYSYKQVLEDILVNNKISGGYYPTNEEFKTELLHNKQTNWHKVKHIKQILYFIENVNNLKERIDLDPLSIEHIMPQSRKNWQHITEDVYKQTVHNLGNITLTAYNGKLSNKTYAEKRPQLLASKFHILNKEIQENEDWNIDIIEQRSQRLVNKMLEVFLMPSNVIDKYQSERNAKNYDDELFFSEIIEANNKGEDRVTGTKLVSFNYKDSKYNVKSFTDLIRILFNEELFSEDQIDDFSKLKIIKSPEKVNSDIYSESNLLTNNLYVYTHLSNVEKINYLQDAFDKLNLDYNDLIIHFKN